jgi:hypothetical protein
VILAVVLGASGDTPIWTPFLPLAGSVIVALIQHSERFRESFAGLILTIGRVAMGVLAIVLVGNIIIENRSESDSAMSTPTNTSSVDLTGGSIPATAQPMIHLCPNVERLDQLKFESKGTFEFDKKDTPDGPTQIVLQVEVVSTSSTHVVTVCRSVTDKYYYYDRSQTRGNLQGQFASATKAEVGFDARQTRDRADLFELRSDGITAIDDSPKYASSNPREIVASLMLKKIRCIEEAYMPPGLQMFADSPSCGEPSINAD